MKADGGDVLQVEVFLRDENGQAAKDDVLKVQVLGDLEILGLENGIPDDLTPYGENWRRTLEGRAILYVRAGRNEGEAGIFVRTEKGLKAKVNVVLKK